MPIRFLAKLARKFATFLELWASRGFGSVVERFRLRFFPSRYVANDSSPNEWWKAYRATGEQLKRWRETVWPENAPTFTVIVPVYNAPTEWLKEAIESVRNQAYSKWQLISVNDCSTAEHVQPLLDTYRDPRIRVIHSGVNRGVAGAINLGLQESIGEYLLILDHDDALEPQCLYRFARAILEEHSPGLLYADEMLTGTDSDDILAVRARPQFSFDYYRNHPYFVHPVCFRMDLVRAVGTLDESLKTSHDVDLTLKVLEKSERVSHIPDVLYRWRTHPGSLGHRTEKQATGNTLKALESHFERMELRPEVSPHPTQFNVFRVRYPIAPNAKVAILIPTKNRCDLLRNCLESLEKTVDPRFAEIVVIDHASDEPESREYLEEVRRRHRVVTATGPFNFSAICNAGVRQLGKQYSHYLFLNNDTVAPEPGWLDAMLSLGCRSDIGIVGATLIYPNDLVQHAGVVVGMTGNADHAFRGQRFGKNHYERETGDNCGLLCDRDYSAVTGACLLIRSELFDRLNGFDEKLAVGFNDTDLCLRAIAAGFRVVNCADAVLFHDESQTRGFEDKHPADTALFRERHSEILSRGDPHFSPLLELNPSMNALNPAATCPDEVAARTVANAVNSK